MNQKYIIDDIEFNFTDNDNSMAVMSIIDDLKIKGYGFEKISFESGDIVIDIGAHVGIISIYLAKKYPFLKIHSFEPSPENFTNFMENIKSNNIENIIPYNLAITSDGRSVRSIFSDSNTGGNTFQTFAKELPGHFGFESESINLDEFFQEMNIDKCKFMKIDCEGSEHEILHSFSQLSKVEYLSAEIHINDYLRDEGYSIDLLIERCLLFIDPEKFFHIPCEMANL